MNVCVCTRVCGCERARMCVYVCACGCVCVHVYVCVVVLSAVSFVTVTAHHLASQTRAEANVRMDIHVCIYVCECLSEQCPVSHSNANFDRTKASVFSNSDEP